MASILVVDPSDSNRLYLKLILEKSGYDVLEAVDGLDAIQKFEIHRPDLVITEIGLPLLSGVQLVQKIKSLTVESFYPVFVVTSELSSDSIHQILKRGADDFLQKPYPEQLFLAKVASLLRNVDFYNDLKKSKELVASLHTNLALEHQSAERIFEKFVNGPGKDVPGLKTHISPASIFNGDVFLSSISPSGNVVTLLGDFTGHGLPAAIGAIPVAEVFYSMVRKGRSIKEVILVMNDKLKTILPVHIFFGCIVVQICPKRKSANVFNAGMQPIVQIDSVTKQVIQHKSSCLPLGVLESTELDVQFKMLQLGGAEQFVFYTDGVVEAMNHDKEMFGVDNLVKSLLDSPTFDIDKLVEDSQAFCRGEPFDDDVSIVKLDASEVLRTPNPMISNAVTERIPPASDWSLSFQFSASNLRHNASPIEFVVDSIMGMQPLIPYKEEIFVILSELFNNALEHGILNLSSDIKQQENGFFIYSQKRQEAIDTLQEGEIHIKIHHVMSSEFSGRMHFTINHTGENTADLDTIGEATDHLFYGRGISIVRSLCSEFHFSHGGAQVDAVFDWEQPGHVE